MKTILKSSLFSLVLLLGLSLILISVTNHYILTLNFYDNSGDYLSGIPDQEAGVYSSLQKYIYISAVVYLLLKLAVIGLIIFTALYLAGKEISFTKAFNIAVNAEFIFLVADVLKVFMFIIKYPQGTMEDWRKLSVFSILSLTGNVSPYWHYPFQTLNIFEIIYWFLLARGVQKHTGLSYDESLRVVTCSYVPALLVWVITITFCTVMASPVIA